MDFKTKRALNDQSLWAAVVSAGALMKYVADDGDIVRSVAAAGAAAIIAVAIHGRFRLRVRSVESAAYAAVNTREESYE